MNKMSANKDEDGNFNMTDNPSAVGLMATDSKRKEEPAITGMIYGVEDRPPWANIVLMGIQHFSVSFSGLLAMPLIIVAPLCFHLDRNLVSQLIATSFFMCGVTTLLQTGLGSRLPILQGMSATFIGPIIIMTNLRGPCPESLPANATEEELNEFREFAYGRMQVVQGSLILASFVQVLIGFTGFVGVLLSVIGPITLASTLIMICIPLIPIATDSCGTHWGIASLCMLLIVIFSQFLDKYNIPCPGKRKLALFTFFPILLAVAITWLICLILTITDVFPNDPAEYGYKARTDIYNTEIKNSVWVRVPYPGQFGLPQVTFSGFVGMAVAVIAGIIESIGDYHACALIACVPPPPTHAINRAVGMEGLGCLLAGFWGTGCGYTSYSNNVCTIGITKVASRRVIYFSACIYIVAGVFAKFAMFCAAIPEAIIGATLACTLGMVASCGFANLQYVKVDTSRNLFILGLALVIGLGIPDYLVKNPGCINTGAELLDQVLDVILGSPLMLGGFTACLLDNLVRGTPEEKGTGWREGIREAVADGEIHEVSEHKCYDLPFGMAWIRRTEWTRYIPFVPTFNGFQKPKRCRKAHFEATGVE